MTNRDNLNRLNVSILKSIATEHGVDVNKKKKADIIADILTCQAPVSALTPVVHRTSEIEAITPASTTGNIEENLPPFNKVSYLNDAYSTHVINFSQIYDFMVSRKRDSGESVGNFKGLDRAAKHFSADVHIIGIAKVAESVMYIKGTCQASMKKHLYDVYVCISNTVTTGGAVIDYGYCQCPVGLAQTYSHVGSLLFVLSNTKVTDRRLATEDINTCSLTSKLCEWNVPCHTVKPRPMSTLKAGKPSLLPNTVTTETVKSKTDSISTFDPRHTSDRNHDVSRTLEHLRDLENRFPNTGLAHLWNIPDQVQDACIEMEVTTIPDPLFLKMENMLFTNASKENLPCVDISEELVNYIEKYTRGQRLSKMWKDLHLGRLTSSIFGDVLSAGDNPKSLVKRIVEGSNLDSYNALPPAVQWGIDCESKAKEDHIFL